MSEHLAESATEHAWTSLRPEAVRHVLHLAATPGATAPWPSWVPPVAITAWQSQGIESPWMHQVDAAQAEVNELTLMSSALRDELKIKDETIAEQRQTMQSAIDKFTSGKVNVILLSARAKASGANLQVASHVIFLDPPGEHADHGATLERQAVGRAVRIGQKKPVTVTRFCVEGTLEQRLWDEIDDASKRISKRDDDQSYVIAEGKDKTLARQVTVETDDIQAHKEEDAQDLLPQG